MNHGESRSTLRGAQSPAFTWMQFAELAGAMYRPSGAPRLAEYPVSVVLLVLNARRVLRTMSSGSIQISSMPVAAFSLR